MKREKIESNIVISIVFAIAFTWFFGMITSCNVSHDLSKTKVACNSRAGKIKKAHYYSVQFPQHYYTRQ